MKKKIFIGSSSESIKVAEKIKDYFQEEYDCIIWNDDFFQVNENTYETLIKKSICFDYAIFIGGKDDIVIRCSNKTTKTAVRDNVYFELGLYSGILQKNRTFFLIDKKVKIATDLLGITVINYSQPNDIVSGCKKIHKKMEEENKINHIRLLPSTSLAISYYDNFLKPLGDVLLEHKNTEWDKKEGGNILPWHISIIIPQNCCIDWERWTNQFYNRENIVNYEIKGVLRNFSIKRYYNKSNNEHKLLLLDVPQILNTSFKAVELVMGKDYVGSTDELNDIKEKETQNFIITLTNLINSNPILKDNVDINREDSN